MEPDPGEGGDDALCIGEKRVKKRVLFAPQLLVFRRGHQDRRAEKQHIERQQTEKTRAEPDEQQPRQRPSRIAHAQTKRGGKTRRAEHKGKQRRIG